MASSRPDPPPHHPGLLLVLGEPAPGGLAFALRTAVRQRLGGAAGVRVRDLGDLRQAGVAGPGSNRLDPFRLRSWAAEELRLATEVHDGASPGHPVIPLLLVSDGDDALNRERLLAAIPPLRMALSDLAAPEALQPRLAVVVAWPASSTAPHAEWLARLAAEVRERESADLAFLVAAAGTGHGREERPRLLPLTERDARVVEDVILFMTSDLLEQVAAQRRGLERAGWCVLARGAPEDEEPWFPAPASRTIRWFPGRGAWMLLPHDSRTVPPDGLVADVRRPERVWCLFGAPTPEPAAPARRLLAEDPELVP